MITPMKKVTVLATAASKAQMLEALRSMGIMHLTPLSTAATAGLNSAKNEKTKVEKALEAIPDKLPKNVAPAEPGMSGEALVEEVQKLLAEKKDAEANFAQSTEELAEYQGFGNFDPEQAAALEKQGVFVRLYMADTRKVPFEVKGDSAFQERFGFVESEDCIAVFSKNAPAEVSGNFTELPIPPRSIQAMRDMQAESRATLARVENRLAALSSVKAEVLRRLDEVSEAYNFEEAAAGTLDSKSVCAIQGYCPANRLGELQNSAKENGWGLLADDPTEDDNVPTLLTYNKLSKPMQFLYDIIGIAPGYREVDVSSVFLCFFSIFFAMIVGDTAYGLLFLAIALFARKKMPKASSAGFHFIYLMSGATIVWGIINASFLGLTPELAGWSYYVDICNYNWLPEPIRNAMYWIRSSAPMDPARFEAYKQFCEGITLLPDTFVPKAAGASQMQHIQLFCFCIAVVHLTIAHLWNVVVRFKQKSSTALAQVGWLMGCWVMFFLACQMVLGIPMPSFVIPVFIVEAVLLVLFTVPVKRLKQDFISIPMLVLDVVNSFTDVISYIRLFAVGMSGAAIAEAFNGMLSPLFGSAVGIAGAAILLLFVHGLNIALAVMGVAVHAVRLNTLEFSNGLGLEWSGFAFTPFAKKKA